MSTNGLPVFDKTIQTTNIWLDEIMSELEWIDRDRAYEALRVVLHALRDRLPLNESAQFAAQLPTMIRGLYYDGWQLAGVPLQIRNKQHFLALAVSRYHARPLDDIEPGIRAVLQVLCNNVDLGEVCQVVLRFLRDGAHPADDFLFV